MRTACQPALAGLFILTFIGCGPMSSPMPSRLGEEAQKDAEKAWNDAFTPPNRLDHQALLDAFLASQAYQVGVDRLTFRSEKKLSQGLLVMEIHFDRLTPEDDRFEVSLFDAKDQRIRHERYNRADVERTSDELFPKIPNEGQCKEEPADWAVKRAIAKKRMEAVAKLLPKNEEKP